MHRNSGPGGLYGWPGLALWVALIVASIVLITMGLWGTWFFIYAPEPAMIERARVGALYVLAGSVSSLAASGMSALLSYPGWVRLFVAAPALLVGVSTLADPTSLFRHMAAAVAFPFAVGALVWGLRYGRQRQSQQP